MKLNQNKKIFEENKIVRINKITIILILFILFTLIISLILTLDSSGFNHADTIFYINKNLIFVIPIASSSLAISSLILQQISNNRLADSSILGIGNINLLSLIILISLVDFNSDYSTNNYLNIYPILFILTSILTCVFIYIISYKKNKNISKKFILIGIILNFTFISITISLESFLAPGKSAAIKQFLNGFLDNSHEMAIYFSLGGFLIGTIWLFFIYEKFKICSTNFYIAQSIGINANSINFQALLISGLLSGVSYILVGNISFLGLLAANIATSIYRKNYNFSIPASCLISSIILGLTFLINKNILNSNINTAGLIPILGIPYFILLLSRDK